MQAENKSILNIIIFFIHEALIMWDWYFLELTTKRKRFLKEWCNKIIESNSLIITRIRIIDYCIVLFNSIYFSYRKIMFYF